jgi:hypothetical protein
MKIGNMHAQPLEIYPVPPAKILNFALNGEW